MKIFEYHIPILFETELYMRKYSFLLGLLVHNNERIHLVTKEDETIEELEKRIFVIRGTAWDLEPNLFYVGSVFIGSSWHIFEKEVKG